jgi:Uma2 family endonuclease
MAIRQPKHPRAERAPRRPAWQSPYHGVRMTPEQYLALPEVKPYLEYVDGMVIQKPMPNKRHSKLAVEVAFFIRLWIREHGGAAGVEARNKAGELPNYRLPDVSFWKPGYEGGDDDPATLAIEIRSPDQTLAELRRKCRFFRDNGVEACWIIDPESRSVEVFEGARDGECIDGDGFLTTGCMPGFELPLAELFAVIED